MFTVKVIEQSSGRPATGVKVSVYINEGFFHFGFTGDQYTDSDGEAHFSNDNCNGTIYVKGKEVYKGYISGRKVVYI